MTRAITVWALAGGIVMLVAILAMMMVPHDVTHTEGEMTWAMMEVARGNPLYDDWRNWPHRFYPYGPLYALVPGWVLRLAGATEFSFLPYIIGRLQSILAIVASIALAGYAFHRMGLGFKLACAAAVAIPVSCPDLILPLVSFRPDFPAFAWCFAAAVVMFTLKSPAALAFSLALYCISLGYKPTLLAFPVAAIISLILFRSGKTALLWLAALIATGIISTLALNSITDGRLLLNIVTGSQMGFTLGNLKMVATMMTTTHDVPVSFQLWTMYGRFALATALAAWFTWKRTSLFETGFSLYFLGSLAVAHLGMLKSGAALHYMLEPYVLSWIVCLAGARRFWLNYHNLQPRSTAIAAALLLALFVLPAAILTVYTGRVAWKTVATLQHPSPYDQLMDLPGDAWLGDLAFIHPSTNAHAVPDPLWYGAMISRDLVNHSTLTDRIAARQFSAIALSPGARHVFFSGDNPPVGSAITANYEQELQLSEFEIWKPIPQNRVTTTSSHEE